MISAILNRFCLPCGKADDTPSPLLPRVRGRRLQLHPRSPWIWGIIDFRSIRVKVKPIMMKMNRICRSRLKNRILVQGPPLKPSGIKRRAEVQPAGILKYSEALKRGPNTEIGPKNFFEIASDKREEFNAVGHFSYPVLRRMLVLILRFA
jgi:hypothetical protein